MRPLLTFRNWKRTGFSFSPAVSKDMRAVSTGQKLLEEDNSCSVSVAMGGLLNCRERTLGNPLPLLTINSNLQFCVAQLALKARFTYPSRSPSMKVFPWWITISNWVTDKQFDSYVSDNCIVWKNFFCMIHRISPYFTAKLFRNAESENRISALVVWLQLQNNRQIHKIE